MDEERKGKGTMSISGGSSLSWLGCKEREGG